MEVLGSRILLHPSEPERSHRFYRDTLGLAIYREFGSRKAPGLVFFLGNGFLEVSGRSTDPHGSAVAIWIQVRDVQLEHDRLLGAGVPVIRKPQQEPWGWWRCGSRTPTECASCSSRFRRITPCDATRGDRFFSRGRRPDGILCGGTDVRGPGLSIERMKACKVHGCSGRKPQ
ncbi:VOC family protein [Arthrobacter sp. ISL-65]|uniref:VOC family protein n=1 Tax=Arthrobacter sp. ISL-65 TaxID=2819112 RepID=UPI0035A87757